MGGFILKKLIACLCSFLLLTALGGCGSRKAKNKISSDISGPAQIVDQAEPDTAVDKIYETIDIRGLSDLDVTALKERFFIDPDLIDELYGKYASGRFGVADVFILKPVDGKLDQVRELLEQAKLNRVKEFENYDIYNAHQIAQDATIFEQGGYLMMLMLEDNASARAIIDQYIPKI